MYKSIALTLVLSLPLNLSLVGQTEDLNHLQQLLSTRKCPQCDLSGSGLVQSNLAGANEKSTTKKLQTLWQDNSQLEKCLASLIKDGLIEKKKEYYSLVD